MSGLIFARTNSYAYLGEPLIAGNKQSRLNEEITAPEIRLIAEDGEQLGIMAIAEAQSMADEANVDLVELVPDAAPPVCRLMDYGKFKFQQKKKLHDQRKKQRQVQIKEIKFRPGTEEGDYQVKMRKMTEFIEIENEKAAAKIQSRPQASPTAAGCVVACTDQFQDSCAHCVVM